VDEEDYSIPEEARRRLKRRKTEILKKWKQKEKERKRGVMYRE